MCPTSVAMPVAVTTIVPAPRVTWVFMKAMSTRSPRAASRRDRVDLLGHRHALAGQRRLVDLERRRGHDPTVGRDEVAGLDVDDVARDQVLHRELDEDAVAADLRLDDHHLLERGDARVGLAFLAEAHRGVEERQADQDDARRDWFGRNRLRTPAASRTICIGSLYWRTNACQRGSWRRRRTGSARSGHGGSRLRQSSDPLPG